MYSNRPGLTLGFHGCDKSILTKVINGSEPLKKSENSYDWLGHGIYFWENSPSRALEYARHLKKNPHKSKEPINEPVVIGAVINLGFCLDLLDYSNLGLLKSGYDILSVLHKESKFPQNRNASGNNDVLIRELDCAVIETLHEIRKFENNPAFDSIRGVFWEGKELYPNAGFKEKNHIQICIRNPNCIKGFFLPREINEHYAKV